jgi:WD40 repeat protein
MKTPSIRSRLTFALLAVMCVLVFGEAGQAGDAMPSPGPRVLHTPSGTDLAFSRDGKRVLICGEDQATVWDTSALRPIAGPFKHASGKPLLLAELSPDAHKVLTVAANEAWLWDIEANKRVLIFKHGGTITWAAFSPDGDRLATCGSDKTARIWDLKSGKQLFVLKHKDSVEYVLFSPDNGSKLLTTESSDPSSACTWRRMWDAHTGRQLWSGGPGTPIRASRISRRYPACFSPDGQRLAYPVTYGVKIVDAEDGTEIAYREEMDDTSWTGIHFDASGKRLFVFGGWYSGIEIPPPDANLALDASKDDMPTVVKFKVEGVQDAVLDHDSGRITFAADTDQPGVWDATTGQRILALTPRVLEDERGKDLPRIMRSDGTPYFLYKVPLIALSPDGKRLAVSYPKDDKHESETSFWGVPNR